MGERHYSTLSWKDRLKIEKMLREGHKPLEIASALRVHNSTIYREIKHWINNYPREILDFFNARTMLLGYLNACGYVQALSIIYSFEIFAHFA